MNNALPLYLNDMTPELPRVGDSHDVRYPTFHLPKLFHDIAQQKIQYERRDRMNLCISDLRIWMIRNKLMINDSKTEF